MFDQQPRRMEGVDYAAIMKIILQNLSVSVVAPIKMPTGNMDQSANHS